MMKVMIAYTEQRCKAHMIMVLVKRGVSHDEYMQLGGHSVVDQSGHFITHELTQVKSAEVRYLDKII